MSKLNRKQARENSSLVPVVITATFAASTFASTLLSTVANAQTKGVDLPSDRSVTSSDVVRSENSSKVVMPKKS